MHINSTINNSDIKYSDNYLINTKLPSVCQNHNNSSPRSVSSVLSCNGRQISYIPLAGQPVPPYRGVMITSPLQEVNFKLNGVSAHGKGV